MRTVFEAYMEGFTFNGILAKWEALLPIIAEPSRSITGEV